jgi:hypothetical protein
VPLLFLKKRQKSKKETTEKKRQQSKKETTSPIFEVRLKQKKLQNLPRRNTGNGVHYCISHPFKRRNWCFGRFIEFLLSRLFFLFHVIQTFMQFIAEACQEGLFTCTIAKRPEINPRMC